MTASFRVVVTLVALTTMACGSDRIGQRDEGLGTTLAITIAADASGRDERAWTLTCDPAGGTHPDPAAACAALERLSDPFARTPRDRVCTQVYGGPAVARVAGTYRGRDVDRRITRENGCELTRWEQFGPVLPGPVPAEPTPAG